MSRLLTEPALILAVLIMVSLAFIPRRYRLQQVLAVLGWAAIWVDNEITGHWLEWVGGTVMVAALGAALAAHRRSSDHLS
jgi:hypothetical protein